jgi:hypothetical protein
MELSSINPRQLPGQYLDRESRQHPTTHLCNSIILYLTDKLLLALASIIILGSESRET